MENASKALLISAGVLFAIIVLTIGVSLRNRFFNSSEGYVARLEGIEVEKYNSNFETYIGRKNITAQEIVTVVGFVRQKQQKTKVYVGDIEITAKTNEEYQQWENKFLKDNILTNVEENGKVITKNTYSYKYNSNPYDEYGMFKEIKFVKN